MVTPGEWWSETLMRRSEEAILVEKIRIEQQRLGVAESDWVGNERERQEEEEEEEGEAAAKEEMEKEREDLTLGLDTKSSRSLELHSNYGACNNMHSTTAETVEEDSSSPDAMIDRMEQFTSIMQQKFLSGEDHQHLDYSKIDHDETFDDHWMKEVIMMLKKNTLMMSEKNSCYTCLVSYFPVWCHIFLIFSFYQVCRIHLLYLFSSCLFSYHIKPFLIDLI
ncbi:unnamed protein product [Fraxinus pennsylvanica]|uniref:CCD97-like C-terminal domain-containing protein n=1 Tax=Fraxinus pennsylvanica TaxID=56036 RepID=A0AAD1YYI9_9LAMI|nr:unnamed protein product [Fraxinus pennsylvanica]